MGQARGDATEALSARDSRTAISSPYLYRLQHRHFIVFDVLPSLGTVAAFAGLYLRPLTLVDVGLFFAFWLATGLAITVGYHRLLAHGAFAAPTWVKVALIIVGSMAARGPAISWVAIHRRHHERSDQEGDPHSPNRSGAGHRGLLRGLVHAQLTWMARHEYPNVKRYVPDLLRDRRIIAANRHYHLWIILGLALPALIGALAERSPVGALTGFLWGGVVRLFVVEQTISAINSLLHSAGTQPFRTRGDNSRNLGSLSVLTWGEAWHNKHHAFPYSAAFGLHWYQLDPGFWVVRALEALGLAWDVKVPTPMQRAATARAALEAEEENVVAPVA